MMAHLGNLKRWSEPRRVSISAIILIIAYCASLRFAFIGYLALIGYALLLLAVSAGSINKSQLFSLHILVFGFACCSLLGKYTTAPLFAVETAKFLSWAATAFILSKMRQESVSSALSFVRAVTIFSLAFIPWQTDRLQGLYSHANHMAYVAAFLIAWTILSESGNAVRRNTFITMLLLVIILSRSSNGLICGLLALTPMILAASRNLTGPKIVGVIGIGTITAALAAHFGLVDETLLKIQQAYESDIVEKAYGENFGAEGSFAWRLSYWLAIYMRFIGEGIQAHVFGLGPGYMGAGNYIYDFMIVDPHNEFLRILTERGVLGLALFLMFLASLVKGTRGLRVICAILILQMLIGNPLVHLPTVLVVLMIASYIAKRNTKVQEISIDAAE